MATTSIIVELLIVGFFTSVWMFLLCLRLSLFDLDSARQFASAVEPTPALLVATAVFYQVGLLMNSISHRITRNFAQLKFRNEIIPDTDYEIVRATVYQKGSDETVKGLGLYLTFVRLSRAGIINFLLIALSMFLFGGKVALAGVIPLIISGVSLFVWRGVFRQYYRRMGFAYQIITNQTAGQPQKTS